MRACCYLILKKSIEPGDIVLFYFAGHGTQWEVCIENLSVKGNTD